MRKCTVNFGKEKSITGMFHQWCNFSKPVGAGLTIGSAPAGVISYTVGLVETDSGQMIEVDPIRITFNQPWEGDECNGIRSSDS